MIKKILLILLFLSCIVLLADKLDDFTRDISSFDKTKVSLNGKEYLIYYKIYKEKLYPEGGKRIFFVLKDEVIKNSRAYLKVIYLTEQKKVEVFGLDEYPDKDIKKTRKQKKSILINLSDRGDIESITAIVIQITK